MSIGTITNIREALDQFDEELDELYPVSILGMTYAASRVLRETDPIAYRVSFWDWLDGMGIDSDELDDYGMNDIPS